MSSLGLDPYSLGKSILSHLFLSEHKNMLVYTAVAPGQSGWLCTCTEQVQLLHLESVGTEI